MLITIKNINMLINRKYILASSSKSRYHILKNAGFNFKKIKPSCNEEEIKKTIKEKTKNPTIIALKLSYEKAKSISKNKKYFNDYVIGCDTLVYLNQLIFDKAKNIMEAKRKIKRLSGKTHKIVSGVTIFYKGRKVQQFSETTKVKIRKLKEKQIDQYFKKTGEQILQSVGCYQIESLGPYIIEYIDGDFFNVMGLPLFKLLKHTSYKK